MEFQLQTETFILQNFIANHDKDACTSNDIDIKS